jgi:hypothetical protein
VAVQTLAAPAATSAAASTVSIFRTEAQHINFQEAACSDNNGSIASWDVEAEESLSLGFVVGDRKIEVARQWEVRDATAMSGTNNTRTM